MTLVALLAIFFTLYAAQLLLNKNFFLKVVVVTFGFYCASAIYFAFDSYKGWPTTQLPEKAVVVSIIVDLPSPDSQGAIYVWAVPIDEQLSWLDYKPNNNSPRGYALPYSDKAAQEYSNAKEQLDKGMVVMMENIGLPPESDTEANEQQDGEVSDKPSNPGDAEEYNVPRLTIISPNQLLTK